MDDNNNATDVIINWFYAIWLFEYLIGLRIGVGNGILPPQIYNWPVTDAIRAAHDGGWDWSTGDLAGRPDHYNSVKQFINRNYPFLNLSYPSTKRQTLFGNQLQERLSQYLDRQVQEQSLPMFGHLSPNHPVIQVIKAKLHLSSDGNIVNYTSLVKAYLKLRPEHRSYFSVTTTAANRNASNYGGDTPVSSGPTLAASEAIPVIIQQLLPRTSLTNFSEIQYERDVDSEILNFELPHPNLSNSVSNPIELRNIGSQFDDFPSLPNGLEHLGHNTLAQTALGISDTTAETSIPNLLPNGTDLIHHSYSATVSAEVSANNLLSIPTNIIPNEVNITVGPIDNYSNPNWYYAPLNSNIFHTAPSSSSTFTSYQQLSHYMPFTTTTQSSHDDTSSSPIVRALSPPESAFTMATDSSTVPNADDYPNNPSSSTNLMETQSYVTDIWDDLESP